MTASMRVAYGKLGRVILFDQSRWKMAGEAEAVNVLYRLARRNPGVEWHVAGKSSGVPDRRYENIITYWSEDTPKSAWGVIKGGGGHQCNYCHTPASMTTYRLECCDRSRDAVKHEEYLAGQMAQMDATLIHLGQHGTSHNFIPKVGKSWDDADPRDRVRPYVWAFNYGGYLTRAVNAFADAHDGGTRRTVWLCADPRNYMNARDIKWPAGLEHNEPVLAQYTCQLNGVHERWQDERTPAELGWLASQDGGLWRVRHYYRQSGLDMMMLPDDWEQWPTREFSVRDPVGVVSTAAYLPRREFRRSAMIADWVLSSFPSAPVYGKWDDRSRADVPADARVIANAPQDFPALLSSMLSTVVLPPTPAGANGVKWCTAKPWQAFAAETVAFMIPPVDAQGWVIPALEPGDGTREIAPGLHSVRDDWESDDLHLARWLRVTDPEDFRAKATAISRDRATYLWLARAQRALLRRRWDLHEIESTIEKRLGIT